MREKYGTPGVSACEEFVEWNCLVGPRSVIWSVSCFREDGPADAGHLLGRSCHNAFRNRGTPCPECPLFLEDSSFFYVRVLGGGRTCDCDARPAFGNAAWSVPLETNPLAFVPVGVCALHASGRPLFWNAEWRRIMGWNGRPESVSSCLREAGAGVTHIPKNDGGGSLSVVSITNDRGVFAKISGDFRWLMAWSDGSGAIAEIHDGNRSAACDRLTGTYTRASFDDILRNADLTSDESPVSVLTLDIDGLNIINEIFGVEQGDAILREMGSILRKACRSRDTIARIGEDEFGILLPGVGADRVECIGRRIALLAAREMRSVPYRFSIGYAARMGPQEPLRDVLRNAELRMRRLKRNSRGSMHHALLQTIEAVMEETSRETKGHADRMRLLCAEMGKLLRMDDESLERLDLVARLHDIGKISVPLSILGKATPLTEDEWTVIRRHPDVGFRIARSSSADIALAADGIRAHHERWDGWGYPRGVSGRDIPYDARIVSIVDACDAMLSERAYKAAMTAEQAKAELIRCAGGQFDPDLVPVFLRVLDASGNEVLPGSASVQ